MRVFEIGVGKGKIVRGKINRWGWDLEKQILNFSLILLNIINVVFNSKKQISIQEKCFLAPNFPKYLPPPFQQLFSVLFIFPPLSSPPSLLSPFTFPNALFSPGFLQYQLFSITAIRKKLKGRKESRKKYGHHPYLEIWMSQTNLEQN